MFHRTLIAATAALGLAAPTLAQTALSLALDWRFEGPAAPYCLAIENDHFEAAGLDVEIAEGAGSLDAIPKVATGAYPVGFPVREPMLADGQLQAVTGFSFTSSLNTEGLGVPMEDLSIMLMADHGVALYGKAIIANTDWAAENPELLTGFLGTVAAGWRDAVADPEAAVAALAARNPAADLALEQNRLQMAIDASVLTPWVIGNGLGGGIDDARMAEAIEQTATVYEFAREPDAALYFDPAYLPTDGSTMLR